PVVEQRERRLLVRGGGHGRVAIRDRADDVEAVLLEIGRNGDEQGGMVVGDETAGRTGHACISCSGRVRTPAGTGSSKAKRVPHRRPRPTEKRPPASSTRSRTRWRPNDPRPSARSTSSGWAPTPSSSTLHSRTPSPRASAMRT